MSASDQEQILAAASQGSLGSSYLFEPDSYSKGRAFREPADLAWLCRRTIFLINMKSGKKRYSVQSEHNFKQLRGWLRAWTGKTLKGANRFREFEVHLADVDQIVLLSVTHCEDSLAEIITDITTHPRSAAEEKVCIAASIPQSVFLNLIQRGGTALDLADLLLYMTTLGPVSEEAALFILAEQHFEAVARVRARMGQAHERDDLLDTQFSQQLVGSLRHQIGLNPRDEDDPSNDNLAFFNDLDWEENAELIFKISDMTKPIRDVPSGEYGLSQLAAVLSFQNYTIIVGAADVSCMVEFTEKMIPIIIDLKEKEPISIINFIHDRPTTTPFYSQTITVQPQTRETSVAKVLLGAKQQQLDNGN